MSLARDRPTAGSTRAFAPRGVDLAASAERAAAQNLLVMTAAVVHPQGESHSQMEGFQGEDRHNPLPHIALSTTALKSAYKNTAFLSTRTTAELRELLIQGGWE